MPCACLPSNAWAHAVVVLDGAAATLTFYRDGIVQKTLSGVSPISRGESALYLGKWSGGTDRLLTGSLDDIAIYNRALREEEVLALHEHPPPDSR